LVEAGRENVVPRAPSKATPVSAAPPVPSKTFEDPAILSMGKRPTVVARPSIANTWTSSTSMERADSSRTARASDERPLRDITPAAILVDPIVNLAIVENEDEEVEEVHILDELEHEVSPVQQPVKPARKPRKRKSRKEKDDLNDPAATPAKETTKSKGWRQTPLLEPNPSFQPYATLKRKGRRNGNHEESGWGTEDATDVQEMGDFDFVGSLAKFDKHTVFTQIQAEDSVADEDRLVAHNRLPKAKPGTAGGKNLHYSENVLEAPKPNGTPKLRTEAWKDDEDSDVEEHASQRGSGSGRISRRAGSRLPSSRRPDSRKGSSIAINLPTRTLSVSAYSIL
jgi:enhancer of mRNA-decapping protein 3